MTAPSEFAFWIRSNPFARVRHPFALPVGGCLGRRRPGLLPDQAARSTTRHASRIHQFIQLMESWSTVAAVTHAK